MVECLAFVHRFTVCNLMMVQMASEKYPVDAYALCAQVFWLQQPKYNYERQMLAHYVHRTAAILWLDDPESVQFVLQK